LTKVGKAVSRSVRPTPASLELSAVNTKLLGVRHKKQPHYVICTPHIS